MKLLALPLATLLLLPCAARAAEDDPGKRVIRVVFLAPDAKLSKADAQAIIAEANSLYSKLGVFMMAELVASAKTFDPLKLDKGVTFAVLGEPKNVRVYAATKDAKNADYLAVNDWRGGVENPELSQNDFIWGGDVKGGRIVAIDANAIEAYGSRYGWTKVQSGALILVHGTGHNADTLGKIDHYGAGIMADGNAREQTISKAANAYTVTTNPVNPNNKLLAAALRERYIK